MRRMDNLLTEAQEDALKDTLEGWELVELLNIHISDVLAVAIDNGWINEENVDDVLLLARI